MQPDGLFKNLKCGAGFVKRGVGFAYGLFDVISEIGLIYLAQQLQQLFKDDTEAHGGDGILNDFVFQGFYFCFKRGDIEHGWEFFMTNLAGGRMVIKDKSLCVAFATVVGCVGTEFVRVKGGTEHAFEFIGKGFGHEVAEVKDG